MCSFITFFKLSDHAFELDDVRGSNSFFYVVISDRSEANIILVARDGVPEELPALIRSFMAMFLKNS